MAFRESRRGRRVVGNVNGGADLLGAIRDACKQHDIVEAEVRGGGTLAGAVLLTGSSTGHLGGPLPAPQLWGRVALGEVELQATLVHQGQTVAGTLVGASAQHVELVIEAFDDLVEKSEPAPANPTWADVVAASRAAPTAKDRAAQGVAGGGKGPIAVAAVAHDGPDDETFVRLGDLIDHPRFGRCEVAQLENDGEFIKVRNTSGRLLRLAVDVLRLAPAGEENGKRLFKARVS